MGSLLIGAFAPSGGVGHTLAVQAVGVGVTAVWAAGATFVLAKVAALAVPMRIDSEGEHEGLDVTSHGERAYELD